MIRLAVGRGLLGVAVLLGASLAVPSPAGRASAVAGGGAPVLLEVDARALTAPADGAEAERGVPRAVAERFRAGEMVDAPGFKPGEGGSPRAGSNPAPGAAPTPLEVVARYVDGSGEPQTLRGNPWPEAWRLTPPGTVYVTEAQLVAAFVQAGIARAEAERLARACVVCEGPYYDVRAGAHGATRAEPSLGAALDARGDRGASRGPCSIHEPTWGHLFAQHDPHTLAGTAALAKAARDESVRLGRDPLWPWTCARGGE